MSCTLLMRAVCCFFKQKTAYEVRISDWSSDVCSSDLIDLPGDPHPVAGRLRAVRDDPGGARAARDARRLWPRERIDPAARSDRAPDPPVVRDAHPAQPRARARPDRAPAVGGAPLPPAARRRPAALAGPAPSADTVPRASLSPTL